MKENSIYGGDIPMGLGMALAQNIRALEKFGRMTPEEKNALIAGTHGISSKEQMQEYVNQIVRDGTM